MKATVQKTLVTHLPAREVNKEENRKYVRKGTGRALSGVLFCFSPSRPSYSDFSTHLPFPQTAVSCGEAVVNILNIHL